MIFNRNRERTPAPQSPETGDQKSERLQALKAMENALDGYAPDGETWANARTVFEEGLVQGRRIDLALTESLDAIATPEGDDPKTAWVEASNRFWNSLDQNKISQAMGNALDGYAIGGGAWEEGLATFKRAREEGVGLESAFMTGLDAAETDQGDQGYHAASERFYNSLTPSPLEDKAKEGFGKHGRRYGLRVSKLGDGAVRNIIDVGIGPKNK